MKAGLMVAKSAVTKVVQKAVWKVGLSAADLAESRAVMTAVEWAVRLAENSVGVLVDLMVE